MLSILKSFDGDPSCCVRNVFTFDAPKAGVGHFIHTYQSDGDPLPSFAGEPEQVALTGDIDAFTQMIWENLTLHRSEGRFCGRADRQQKSVRRSPK